MCHSNKKARQEEKQEVPAVIPNWSELCPDLLRYVFKKLSFTNLNRAKSVCSSWHSASRGCIPKQNQIPWLILFPCNTYDNKSKGCVLFFPEDKEKVYKTRYLGVEFAQSRCLATYGSWLLMMNYFLDKVFIINLATGEKVDLPEDDRRSRFFKSTLNSIKACFWIDNKTKDYLVVLTSSSCAMFTKKGLNKWDDFPLLECYEEILYNHKNQKLYTYNPNAPVKIWDISGDIPRQDGFLDRFRVNDHGIRDLNYLSYVFRRRLAVTISGDVLIVSSPRLVGYKGWGFSIYKANHVKHEWVRIASLGDEALILDMGITVVAKDVPGIKRNSIYFSGHGYGQKDPDDIFVFDLATQKVEPLPQCVFSSIQFSHARWFLPGFHG